MTAVVEITAASERLRNWFSASSHSQLRTEDIDEDLNGLYRFTDWLAHTSANAPATNEILLRQVRGLRNTLYRLENLLDSYYLGVASSGGGSIRKKRISDSKANKNFRADLSSLTYLMRHLWRYVPEHARISNPAAIDHLHGPAAGTWVHSGDENIIMINDKEKQPLISALKRGSDTIQVISICGMAGTGKTTLAKTVYDHDMIKSHFDLRAWVVLTPEFRTRDIFSSIASCIGPQSSEFSSMDEMDLALAVYQGMKGRRWLVVLDDIRSMESWKRIRSAFPDNRNGSRVLTTTRIEDVAADLSGDGQNVQNMTTLDKEQSWMLFLARMTQSGGGDIISMHADEEKQLISALMRGSDDIKVISIRGTDEEVLQRAKELYNDRRIKFHFDFRAWVDVTPNSGTKGILLTIARPQSSESSSESSSTHEIDLAENVDEIGLAQKVHKFLKTKSWLVVLNGKWSRETWMGIRRVFPDDRRGSRVLLATRSTADQMMPCNLYPSKELLFWELAGSGDADLTEKQRKIAERLIDLSDGLPLAIVLLAGILKSKPVEEWTSLLMDVQCERYHSNSVSWLLRSSYNTLPSFLAPCLVYMGNFPRGSKIEVDTLCQLWIAEGLVSETICSPEETLMELAVEYFHELAARNLVHLREEEMSNLQGFSYGSLYDLMRDFCIAKANEDEFFEIVMPESKNEPTRSVFRRAVYLDKHGDMDIRLYLGSELRTLLFFNSFQQPGEELGFPQAIPDLKSQKWMRILHFDGVNFKGGKLPAGIGNLVLLRHLSFKDCCMEELPSSIGNLILLLNLDLRVRKECRVTIPNVLFKLERLRHLYLPLKFQTKNLDKLQFDGMKELEILENFDTSMCNAGEIAKLTKLRKLGVCAEGNIEDLEMIFKCIEGNEGHLKKTTFDIRNFHSYSEARLSFIEKLFKCHVLHVLRLEGRIGKIPEFHAISESFTEIHLSGSQLEDDPMKTLSRLRNLRILALETEAYIGKEMHCQEDGFAELRTLKLSKLYNLENLQVKGWALPQLSTLSIENCRRMKRLPEGLKFVKTLRKLTINMMPQNFVARLQKVDGKGGEDLHKINPKCIIEFGNEPQLTYSTTEQYNSFQGRNFEFQKLTTSTETPYFA